ncbi:MAG: CorA family divalent cation transporter [Dehalobacterium sp.]
MIYYINNGRIVKSDTLPGEYLNLQPSLCFFSKEEFIAATEALQISDRIVQEYRIGHAFKFESHEGLDYISLRIPDPEHKLQKRNHICIYFRHNLLIFVSDNLEKLRVFQKLYGELELGEKEPRNLSLAKILQLFFDILTIEDSLILESIEDEASKMEEALITLKSRNYISEIIKLRKKLLAYKRYYDQLAYISLAIEENESGLLSDKEVRFFHKLSSRTERLLNEIENLQNYISQIREAYQAQVDINQNSIMKLFTVITAIFLPLTLIVGWYGMNLDMPEYNWPFGYPAVILLSIIVALGSFLYFKKHDWF